MPRAATSAKERLFFLLLSVKNRQTARKFLMHHTYKRFCRKGACLSGACAKRHTDLIAMSAYTERCTHVHRTTYVRTPNTVCTYTGRRTCPSAREAAAKRAGRKGVKHLEDYMSGHGGTTSLRRPPSAKITMRRSAGRSDCRVWMKLQMLTGGLVSFCFNF